MYSSLGPDDAIETLKDQWIWRLLWLCHKSEPQQLSFQMAFDLERALPLPREAFLEVSRSDRCQKHVLRLFRNRLETGGAVPPLCTNQIFGKIL